MTLGARFFDPARQRSLGGALPDRPVYAAFRQLIWRRIPRPLRQAALRLLLGRRGAALAQGCPACAPISVIGLLSTATGIGEGGRLAGRALAGLGHDVRGVDVSTLLEAAPAPAVAPPPLECGAGTAILHFNPDNLPAMLTLLGRERLRGKRIVGYWAWELERAPDAWRPAFAEVDEIWVPTRFVAEAVRPLTTKTIRVVPHPVAIEPVGRRRRADFAMEAGFVALTMFSFASFTRKNPVGAVRAFRLAFGDAPDRQLIVKCIGNGAPNDRRALQTAIGDAANIRLVDAHMDPRERLDLIAGADVLLSLHRSEGFGLVLAEAMLAGVPVVATGWSGNLDFMDESCASLVPYRLVPARDSLAVYAGTDGCWAEPDIEEAAARLARLAADPGGAAAMRRAAVTRAREALGLEAFQRAVAPALPAPRLPREGDA